MNIRRVIGAYFSPTGNTEKLAKAMEAGKTHPAFVLYK
jgi:flavodoxin